MIDFWDESVRKGVKKDIPVIAINDLEKGWSGTVRLRVMMGDDVVQEQELTILIPSFGKSEFSFTLDPIRSPGNYTIDVSLLNTPFGTIRSVRDFKI
jgi:hypothetical protein